MSSLGVFFSGRACRRQACRRGANHPTHSGCIIRFLDIGATQPVGLSALFSPLCPQAKAKYLPSPRTCFWSRSCVNSPKLSYFRRKLCNSGPSPLIKFCYGAQLREIKSRTRSVNFPIILNWSEEQLKTRDFLSFPCCQTVEKTCGSWSFHYSKCNFFGQSVSAELKGVLGSCILEVRKEDVMPVATTLTANAGSKSN